MTRRHAARVATITICSSALALSTLAEEPPLPDGRSVLERYIELIGGKDALDRVESVHIEGSYTLTSFGLEGSIVLNCFRPDALRFTVNLDGIGTIEQGMHDGIIWRIDPNSGAQTFEGKRGDQVRAQAMRGFSLLPSIEQYDLIQTEGFTTYDGKSTIKVRLSLRGIDAEYFEHFDVETGLLVGRVETLETAQGPVELKAWAGDYKEFDGILVPVAWKHNAGQQEWEAEYTSVRWNAVDQTKLVPPAAVLELVGE